jgi:hypothetical protein
VHSRNPQIRVAAQWTTWTTWCLNCKLYMNTGVHGKPTMVPCRPPSQGVPDRIAASHSDGTAAHTPAAEMACSVAASYEEGRPLRGHRANLAIWLLQPPPISISVSVHARLLYMLPFAFQCRFTLRLRVTSFRLLVGFEVGDTRSLKELFGLNSAYFHC